MSFNFCRTDILNTQICRIFLVLYKYFIFQVGLKYFFLNSPHKFKIMRELTLAIFRLFLLIVAPTTTAAETEIEVQYLIFKI